MNDKKLILPTSDEQENTGYGDIGPVSDEDLDAEVSRVERLAAAGLPATAITAFAVVLTEGGQWAGTSHFELATEIILDRESTLTDMVLGSLAVHGDAEAQRIAAMCANQVMTAMAAQVQSIQAQQQQQRIMSSLRNPGANHR